MEDMPSPSPSDASTAPGEGAPELMDMDLVEEIDQMFNYITNEIEMERAHVCQSISIGPGENENKLKRDDRNKQRKFDWSGESNQ